MDKRINYKIVLDTETCPLDKDLKDVDPYNMFVYDIGWIVTDKRGKIYESRSYVNADIFLGERKLMKSAYYAEKIPKYWEQIKNGERILARSYTIRQQLIKDIMKYEALQIYCHNARFDLFSLNNTIRWETTSRFRYYFPKDVVICDTLKMARDVANTPMYKSWCKNNGFVTAKGRPRFTAESLYAYITGNPDFKESHTALEDVMIEKEIMVYCFKKHKKMRKELFKKIA